jgi:hypothetical protein
MVIRRALVMVLHPSSKFLYPYFLTDMLVVSYVLSCAEYLS